MKKILLLLVLVILVSACNKDREPYLGTWHAVYAEIDHLPDVDFVPSQLDIHKTDDGLIAVEFDIINEFFAVNSADYTWNRVEFSFYKFSPSGWEIITYGDLLYEDNFISLQMTRETWIGDDLVDITTYYLEYE